MLHSSYCEYLLHIHKFTSFYTIFISKNCWMEFHLTHFNWVSIRLRCTLYETVVLKQVLTYIHKMYGIVRQTAAIGTATRIPTTSENKWTQLNFTYCEKKVCNCLWSMWMVNKEDVLMSLNSHWLTHHSFWMRNLGCVEILPYYSVEYDDDKTKWVYFFFITKISIHFSHNCECVMLCTLVQCFKNWNFFRRLSIGTKWHFSDDCVLKIQPFLCIHIIWMG